MRSGREVAATTKTPSSPPRRPAPSVAGSPRGPSPPCCHARAWAQWHRTRRRTGCRAPPSLRAQTRPAPPAPRPLMYLFRSSGPFTEMQRRPQASAAQPPPHASSRTRGVRTAAPVRRRRGADPKTRGWRAGSSRISRRVEHTGARPPTSAQLRLSPSDPRALRPWHSAWLREGAQPEQPGSPPWRRRRQPREPPSTARPPGPRGAPAWHVPPGLNAPVFGCRSGSASSLLLCVSPPMALLAAATATARSTSMPTSPASKPWHLADTSATSSSAANAQRRWTADASICARSSCPGAAISTLKSNLHRRDRPWGSEIGGEALTYCQKKGTLGTQPV